MNRRRHTETALAINAATREIADRKNIRDTPPRQLSPSDLMRRGHSLSICKIEAHLLFMADDVATLLTEVIGCENAFVLSDDELIERLTKSQRWIGFIQGALWALGSTTIDSLRETTRKAIDRGRAKAAAEDNPVGAAIASGFSAIRTEAARREARSAMHCEHANECPMVCPCDPSCYCKDHTCVGRGQVRK